MRSRQGIVVGLALCALLSAGAGCGRDAADQFRNQADAICAEGNAAIDRLAKDFGEDGPTPEQLAEAAPQVPGLMGGELDRLAALEPPEALADRYGAMLADFRAVLETMREQGTAFFERTDEPFAEAYAQAADLGLDECAH